MIANHERVALAHLPFVEINHNKIDYRSQCLPPRALRRVGHFRAL